MKSKVLPVLFLAVAVCLTVLAAGQTQASKTAVDPVCGMSVVKDGAKWTYDYKGTTYYFCSESCKTGFAKEPEKYLAKAAEAKKEEPAMMGGMMQGHMQGQAAEAGKAAAGTMGHGAMMGEMMAKQGGMQMQGRMPHMQGMMDGMMGRRMMGMRPGMRMPMRPGMMGGMMGSMMSGAFGFGPMMMDGVDKKIENTKDGVVITLSSKDPETVKMIQDRLARMLEREKMMKAMDEAKK